MLIVMTYSVAGCHPNISAFFLSIAIMGAVICVILIFMEFSKVKVTIINKIKKLTIASKYN